MEGDSRRRLLSILLSLLAFGLIVTVTIYLSGDREIPKPESQPKLHSTIDPSEDPSFIKVLMRGTLNDTAASAIVYWNNTTQELYLQAEGLKPARQGMKLELWAIQHGKFVPIGTFDPPLGELKLMKGIQGASAYAVTVEPAEGKSVPTLETMQVIGPVVLKVP